MVTIRKSTDSGLFAPALRTAGGWFIAPTGAEFGVEPAAGSVFTTTLSLRAVSMSDVIPGGQPEIVFDLESPVTVTGGMAGGAKAKPWTNGAVAQLCGFGSSTTPACIDPIYARSNVAGSSSTMPAAGLIAPWTVKPVPAGPPLFAYVASDEVTILREAGDFSHHRSEVLAGDYAVHFR